MRQFTLNKFLSVADILMVLLIFVLKFFLIKFILLRKYQTVEKKQLLMILSVFGKFIFSNQDQIKQLHKKPGALSCFSQKHVYLDCLTSNAVFPNTFARILFINFGIVAGKQLNLEKQKVIFVQASRHLGITPLTQKRINSPKKSAIMDRILLEFHNTT